MEDVPHFGYIIDDWTITNNSQFWIAAIENRWISTAIPWNIWVVQSFR